MAKLNILDYNFGSALIFSEMEQGKICICCQAKETKLIKLKDCKHSSIFEYIYLSEVDKSLAMVCYMCHALIKKCHAFKTQVETSLSKLKMLRECHFDNAKELEVKTFQFSNIEVNSTVDSKPVVFESIPFPVALNIELETEIKIEHESYSDIEQESVVFQKIKKAKKSRKKRIKPRPSPLEAKYEGVLKIITLSSEEMLQERREEALKKGYVNLPFKCENCVTGFEFELTLKEHIEKRHSQKSGGFTCDICKSVLSTKTSFREHSTRHYKRYECTTCGKRYCNVFSVLKHYKELHGEIDTHYACNKCDFTTDSYRKYRYHLGKHRAGKVECAECGSSFMCKTGLRTHIMTIHAKTVRMYECEQCGKRYRAKSGLTAHAAAHAPAPPACCETCHTVFRDAACLRNHLKTHSRHVDESDKKFTCDECGNKFLSKKLLREHVDWVHLNIKYGCNECSKVFKAQATLKKHKDFVHEKKRPPRNKICDHCGRSFTTLSILRTHIRTHTGERPHKCARCPASFAHSAALYTHNKMLHAR